MACHRKETRLGAARRIGLVARFRQRALGLGAVRDVAPHALQLRGLPGIRANETLAPGDPPRTERALDLLVVDPRAVVFQGAVALLDDLEAETAADQGLARPVGHLAVGVIGKGDRAACVAHDDQVALRFEQAARAFLCLLQFPIAIGERFIVKRDLAELLALEPEADAQRRKRHAGDGEQKARADRESVRVIA